jgi:fructose-1,6-bisphosphatase/inositol monophosphatase family enzyme/ADP-ribosylglycohydrolase
VNSFAPYLDLAIRASRAAGDLLRADFHRPLGPRGEKDKAPADTEAEKLIREILFGGGGDWGFLGEETGRIRGAPGAPVWVVDPNDGTRDYIRGRRGSSVSIALIWDRRPVLGVVHAFGYPDDRGAVYAAVQGREGVWKDGAPCIAKLPERLGDTDVVLVSGGGDRAARANLQCTKPARMMSIPSIAHRLARVAAGEAAATASLYSPRSWDFAAGHCLLLAAGGALVDQNGEDPSYDDEGNATAPRLFAGSRAVALELSGRNWDIAFRSEREAAIPIVRLARGGAVSDAALLSRAQGALIGHLAGSSLGSAQRPGVNRLPAAGQIGSAGEIAIACARSILDPEGVAQARAAAYAAWAGSSPLEPDRAMNAAAAGLSPSDGLSSAALSRLTPLALWGHPADGALLVTRVRADTALTHNGEATSDAAAVLAIVLQSLLSGKSAAEAQATGHAFARRSGSASAVIDAVAGSRDLARAERPSVDAPDVTAAVRVILWSLANAASFEDAVTLAIARSPASDALPALVGGFMGALLGREGIPVRLRTLVLSCRPMDGLVASARPAAYWATDAMTIAEALLTAR